jgi:hypothetical protein
MWRSVIRWAVSDIPSKRCQTLTQLSSVTIQKAWILSNATVRISDILFKHVDIFEFWGFKSGVIEGCIHRRNLANKTGRQNRSWLLGTLTRVSSYKEGEDWFESVLTILTRLSPHFHPSFICLFTAGAKRKLFSNREKCVEGIHPPCPPGYANFCSRMGSDAMSLGNCFLTFRRNVLPSS